MVRFPHKVTLITPGTETWIKGKPTYGTPTEMLVDCEVQSDSSGFTETVNGTSVIAKYRMFFKDFSGLSKTAQRLKYDGRDYDILLILPNQHGVVIKFG